MENFHLNLLLGNMIFHLFPKYAFFFIHLLIKQLLSVYNLQFTRLSARDTTMKETSSWPWWLHGLMWKIKLFTEIHRDIGASKRNPNWKGLRYRKLPGEEWTWMKSSRVDGSGEKGVPGRSDTWTNTEMRILKMHKMEGKQFSHLKCKLQDRKCWGLILRGEQVLEAIMCHVKELVC